MEAILGLLLGVLPLFYPLLIASGIAFVYAMARRSWKAMALSGALLVPDAWYVSGYPALPWAKFVPLLQLALAIWFYAKRNPPR